MPNPSLDIISLRGGLNDSDNPSAIADDQCTVATNVEFFHSTLGERRNGCSVFDITGSDLEDETTMVHLSQWFPTNNPLAAELWAVAATPSTSATWARFDTSGVWHEVVPTDAPVFTAPDIFGIVTQPLNGQLFFAYHSAVNRMHVWDGTTLRPAGLSQPVAAPTGANTGVGTFGGTRYYRVRYTTQVAGATTERSEPSAVLTFTPSGTGTGVIVTRPALLSEGETHWELEASLDNVLFYRIATTVVGTSTATDSVSNTVGYAATGTLSENIGNYLLLPSAKYLLVDGDRLVFASHWTDLTKQSQVGWTPVTNDPGVGNSERLPLNVNNTLNLDNYVGGGITGLGKTVNNSWYAFKWLGIYKMTRTFDVTNAYAPATVSTERGALPGSVVAGMDENGRACLYFLDPVMGPSRLGPSGLEVIIGLRKTWNTVNMRAANVVARGIYYPYKQQVHWWVATGTSDTPTLKLVLQVSELQSTGNGGARRGWSLATGTIATATAVTVFNETVVEDGNTVLRELPYIGISTPNFIQRCDVATSDAGVAYVAVIRTKPFFLAGLLNRWGAMCGTLLAASNAAAGIVVKFIRDYSIETNQKTGSLAPVGTEEYVVVDFDDLDISDNRAVQIEFTDP